MKKFTNIEETKKIEKITPKNNALVEKLVSLNLSVSYSGNSDDIVGKDIKVNGSNKLVESLNTLIKENNDLSDKKLSERLKYSTVYVDQVEKNIKIEQLKESRYNSIIFSPEDIFSANDLIKENKIFTLNSMTSIPLDYLSKVNTIEATDYFSNGNKVSIIYEGLDKGWTLSFLSANTYGGSTDDDYSKYQIFMTENKDFISDFVSATAQLVGSKNLKLDEKLLG